MESRAKLLGHPIHPMLIVLPLGLFIGAVVFDAVSVVWLLPPNRNTSISTSTTAPAIQPHMAFEP